MRLDRRLVTQSGNWPRTTGAEAEKALNSIKSAGSVEGDSILDLEGGGGTVRRQRAFPGIDCYQESVHMGPFDISLCLATLAEQRPPFQDIAEFG